MKKELIFTGSGVALVTPFYPDMTVNYEELERILEFQIENGTDAIISCGTTGEAATLSGEEHLQVLKFTIEKVHGRVPVIAGTGSNDTAYAVELSKEAESLGADGLLLVTPYYNKTSQRGLVESFNYIASSVHTPCILYNVPSRTGLNILPETYLELSKHPNIVGIKEANHDISALTRTVQLCGDSLAVYSGEDIQTLPIIALGGVGVISVFANVMPREMHDLCVAAMEERISEARTITLRYADLMNALFMDVNPIPVKAAMNRMGFACGRCRMPLTEMLPKDEEALYAVLKKYLNV